MAEYESDLLILREDLAAKESTIADIQAVNQVLRDEYQTLNLAFTALEDKYRRAQVGYVLNYYVVKLQVLSVKKYLINFCRFAKCK